MSRPGSAHVITIEVVEPLPPEIPVGGMMTIKVRVSCSDGGDLRNVPLKVIGSDGAGIASDFAIDEEDDCGEVRVKAPARAGDHAWSLVRPAQQTSAVAHLETAVPLSFRTVAVDSSLAVWDIPPSVVTGDHFQIKVGAKSSADCSLAGKGIEICGEDGRAVARGILGDAPFPGTTALYWADVQLAAPPQAGLCSLSARFAADGLELDHNSSSTGFGLVVVRPPEHRVTVRVMEEGTGTPVGNVQIREVTDA